MITPEEMLKKTGVVITPVEAEVISELITNYLGYKLIESEREQTSSYSNIVEFWYPNVTSVSKVLYGDTEIKNYKFTDTQLGLPRIDRDGGYFNFPYESEEKEVKVNYVAGYKESEIPSSVYLAGVEFLGIMNGSTRTLTSYGIDSIKETYSSNEFKKIDLLLGDFICK